MGTNREMRKCERKHHEVSRIPVQISQRGCGVFVFQVIQNLTGHDPEQPPLADPVLRRVFC